MFGTQGLTHNLHVTLRRHEREGIITVTHKPDSSARIDYVELAPQERAGRLAIEVYVEVADSKERAKARL